MKKMVHLISDAWIQYSYAPVIGRPGYERGRNSFLNSIYEQNQALSSDE